MASHRGLTEESYKLLQYIEKYVCSEVYSNSKDPTLIPKSFASNSTMTNENTINTLSRLTM